MEIRLIDMYGAEGEEAEEEKVEGEVSEEEEPETRELTAKEVEAMLARASGRGERRAIKRLAKELGFGGVGEMKEFVASQKEAADAAKSDEQKRLEAADKKSARAEAEAGKLQDDRLMVAVERAIVREGVTEQKKLDRLATLVWAELDDELEEEEWPDAITEAVSTIKADMEEMFTGRKPSGSGDGGAEGPSKPQGEQDREEKQWEEEYRRKGLVSTIPIQK